MSARLEFFDSVFPGFASPTLPCIDRQYKSTLSTILLGPNKSQGHPRSFVDAHLIFVLLSPVFTHYLNRSAAGWHCLLNLLGKISKNSNSSFSTLTPSSISSRTALQSDTRFLFHIEVIEDMSTLKISSGQTLPLPSFSLSQTHSHSTHAQRGRGCLPAPLDGIKDMTSL